MNDKYELTDITLKIDTRVLHRIKAKKDLKFVKCGELGGFLEKEENLTVLGDALVSGDARVEQGKMAEGAKE